MEEIGHTQSAVERKMTSLHSELRELDLAFQRKLDELEAVVKVLLSILVKFLYTSQHPSNPALSTSASQESEQQSIYCLK